MALNDHDLGQARRLASLLRLGLDTMKDFDESESPSTRLGLQGVLSITRPRVVLEAIRILDAVRR